MEVSGFSAQYGKMAGGILNMVLKSGTNQLHGTVFEYFRNDVFDARSFFDPVRLPLHRNQFGATVTGPAPAASCTPSRGSDRAPARGPGRSPP
jgi:hypothetical protein